MYIEKIYQMILISCLKGRLKHIRDENLMVSETVMKKGHVPLPEYDLDFWKRML